MLHLDFGAELGRDFEALIQAVRDAGNTGTDTIESADVAAGAVWTVSSQTPVVVSARAGAAAFRFA
ncbi:MAG: hypothetical protein OXU22_08085, partial [Gammaproteobacteria bacterium]|nr:hypothetical protein [Gammaproteobacteria bacterium]